MHFLTYSFKIAQSLSRTEGLKEDPNRAYAARETRSFIHKNNHPGSFGARWRGFGKVSCGYCRAAFLPPGNFSRDEAGLHLELGKNRGDFLVCSYGLG
ncbi:hypothetical protein DF3PA_30008 [Candidatus Defluviicoccus seviourii]|uniref:Uncharacterized protein n=1 Tax=Candidatus Defluviicoccus seviourii TaxID=2565273 RepID=A0A564WE86_9PROT|nr:hypothetical protein DF3PA_30008 [Candidatus Defluviicoccus seviourii]